MKKTINSGLILLTAILLLAACAKENGLRYDFNTDANTPARYPDASFAVISDTHIYDASLGSSGAAFEKVMYSDRKLLLDSQDLLEFAIDEIIQKKVSFVLIPGDLTKDGELVTHTISAEKLKRLREADIAVFVVPGNHDINNPDAVKFIEDKHEQVATISMQDFARIYVDFGYNAAILRDDDSLSYVAEPVDGLWLLALDVCRYRENVPGKHEIVSGKISQQTADWIAGVLREAASKNKAVIAMIHHGVVEHWKGQGKLHPDYLINDYENFQKFLASWDVRLVFTGHYHALDITRGEYNGKYIYDIETGSLVTAPCPIRYLEIKNNALNIRTETIVDKLYPGTGFAANAHAFVKKTVELEASNVLKKFKVSANNIAIIAGAVGDAFSEHYSGDENAALRPPLDRKKLNLWGRFVLKQQQYVLDGLWNDLPPGDNDVRIDLD